MSRRIIEKQTAAAVGTVTIAASFNNPKTIMVVGALTTEVISVYTVDIDGAELPLYDEDGIAVTLGATSAPLAVYSPMKLKFSKPTTTNNVGVELVD